MTNSRLGPWTASIPSNLHLQPERMHHSFHRNEKFHCEIHVPPTYTTTRAISGIQRNSCKMAKKMFSQYEQAKKTNLHHGYRAETCRPLCNSSLSVGEKKGSSVLPQKYSLLHSVKIAKSYFAKSIQDENTEMHSQSLAQYQKIPLKSKCFQA